MKFADLNANEKAFYRKMYEATELVVGGYENVIQDGGTVENPPTVEEVMSEAYGEVGIDINNQRDTHLHFIGKERMGELATIAAKRSLKDSMFA